MEVLYTILQWLENWSLLGCLFRNWRMCIPELEKDNSNKEIFEVLLPEPEKDKSNKEIFEELKNDEELGLFFRREKYELQFHDMPPIGEGSQAEIFQATGTLRSGKSMLLAVKAYRAGISLRELQLLWPHQLRTDRVGHQLASLVQVAVEHDRLKINNDNYYLCLPVGATVLEDDRFAFIFPRFGGDFRKLIDMKMRKKGQEGPPLLPCKHIWSILHHIAKGMKMLHELGFLHRDLKASNILYVDHGEPKHSKDSDSISRLRIADFESSVHTVGTGFWRAPEILEQVKNRISPIIFTPAADAYSYAMTCYEFLTGLQPLEGQVEPNNYDFVIHGGRPTLPEDVIPGVNDLVKRCWQENPFQRPSFKEIVRDLEGINPKCKHAHCGQYKQKNNNRRGKRPIVSLGSIEIVPKNEQRHSKNPRSLPSPRPSPRPSPQNVVVLKEQKKKQIRWKKIRSFTRREKTNVHS